MIISAPFSRHRRRLIRLGFVILVFASGAQAASAQAAADTAALGALRSANARLEARVDSMRQELRDHRFAENFVSDALEEQANRFALIVTFAVAAVAAFTYGNIVLKFRRVRRYLNERVNTLEVRLSESDAFMHRAAGNAYVAIASIYQESEPGHAVAAWLLAAGNFYAVQSALGPADTSLGSTNLRYAREALSEVTQRDRAQIGAQLQASERLWREAFKLLRHWGGPGTEDEVSDIHASILKLLPEAPEALPPEAAGRLTGTAASR